MATKVSIANLALVSLHADTVTALTESSENARKINAIYADILKALLRKAFWNFAKKEAALAEATETPVLEDFSNVFQLPTDYVRLIKTNLPEGSSYKIKGTKIYCNSDTLSIEYIYYCDDPNDYDASFIEAFAAKLAAELCYSITGNATLVQTKWQEFKEKFAYAKSESAQENEPDKPRTSSWIKARQ